MEINELAKGLPERKICIQDENLFLEKRLPLQSPFSASLAEPEYAQSVLKTPSGCPNSGINEDRPVFSAADSKCASEGTVPVGNRVIPILLLGLTIALFLAVIIPWLLVGGRSETVAGTVYDTTGLRPFSRPATAGGVTKETNPNFVYVVNEPDSTLFRSLSGPKPLNAAVGPHQAPHSESDRTPGISSENPSLPRQVAPDTGTRAATLEGLSKQLQKIETQQRECEVVLKLLDSEAGTFAGFVPEDNLTGVSYLARFQEKIVQLEINKRSLAVKFTPRSREILGIDLEIQGIKAAMRECLEANLRFLKKDREVLLAHKAQLEGNKGLIGAEDKASRPQLSDLSDAERLWFSVSGGIGAIGRGFKNTLACVSLVPSAEPPSRLTTDGGWSQLASSGQDNRSDPQQRSLQQNPTASSPPAVKTTSRVSHRATQQTVSKGAGQPKTNPDAAIRSQVWVWELPLATDYGR